MKSIERDSLPKQSKLSRMLISALLIATLPIALLLTFFAIENAPESVTPLEKKMAPQIDVISVKPSSEFARIEAFGEALPRYELALPAEVAGVVEWVSPRFKSGHLVKQGDNLVTLNDLNYRQELAATEQGLAQARLELLQAEREAQQAQEEWDQSGQKGQPESPLVLREPYVTVARAQVKQAQLAVDQAKADLARTHISPPFDALIKATSLAPGQYVQPGEIIATLYDTAQMEIRLLISESQWALLPDANTLIESAWPVTLTSVGVSSAAASATSTTESADRSEQPKRWTGYVARVEQHIESVSRQRALIVMVEQSVEAQQPLLPGTFLNAALEGKRYEQVLAISASSLSRTGHIWIVDTANQLQRSKVNVLFEHQGSLFIKQPVNQTSNLGEPLLVAVKPLMTYTVGQSVEPKLITQPIPSVAISNNQTARLLGVQ